MGSSLEVTYADGTKQSFKLGYQPLFLTGDQVPDGKGGTVLAGGYYDVSGKPILDNSATPPTPIFSDSPDGYSLLSLPGASVPGVTGNTVFAVVQFEYTTRDAKDESLYGLLPAQIAVLTLDQDKQTGALKLVKYEPVDATKVHGLWTTCGASLSPWNTHLSSEEYEPDATVADKDATFQAYAKNFYGDASKGNPYHYGHLPEVVVNADGTGTLTKHYNLGRISHELVQVMPDQRTVIMGDDATNGGLFMFIADKPADLSAGTLYVAKVAQQPDVAVDQGGAFDLTWIPLGHATSDEIEQLADTLKAADILDVKTKDPQDAELHGHPLQRQGPMGEVQAGHGEGRGLPRDPSLGADRRRHADLQQAGGRHRQCQGQDGLYGDVLHLQIHERRQERDQGHGDQLRRGLSAPPQGRPERQHGQGDRQRLGPRPYERRAGAGRQGSEGARRRRQYRGCRPHRQPRQSQILGAAARSPHRRG